MNEKTVSVVAGQAPVKTGEQGISYRLIPKTTRLPFSGTSYLQVKKSLTNAFGPFPIRLSGGEQLMILRGMMCASEGPEVYRILMNALSQAGEIEISDG